MVLKLENSFKCVLHKYPVTDNFIFYLCYRVTVLLLLVFSFVITCRLMLGNSFVCTPFYGNDVPSRFTTVKCYEEGVHMKPAKFFPKEEKGASYTSEASGFQKHLYYYPWVNLLFLILAFNFYLPHLLWKSYERGYIRRLCAGVEKYFDKEEKRGLELCYLAKYVLITQGKHKIYTYLYIFFEICNCGISLAQTLWLVHFFDVTGVPEILPIQIKTWSDFRLFYFPLEGSCEYTTLDMYGDEMPKRIKCLLPLNHLYMRMFLFLYAWFVLLTVLCGIVLIYRLVLVASYVRADVMKIRTPLAEKSILKSLCSRLSYSDWFFLTRLQKMMTDVDFVQLVSKVTVVSQIKTPDLETDDGYRSSRFENIHKDLDTFVATSSL